MFSPLRNRFGIPGVISVIALVFAMFGGAYAASDPGSSDSEASASAKAKKAKKGPRGPKGPKGDTGAAGPAGPAGPAGAKGDAGPKGDKGDTGNAGAAGDSVTGTPIAAGGACGAGVTGVKYTLKTTSTNVCNGKNGETGFVEKLPSGETLTGVWGTSGGVDNDGEETVVGDLSWIPISYAFPVSPAPNFYYVLSEGGVFGVSPTNEILLPEPEEADEACPGTAAAPSAGPGSLCVYELNNESVSATAWFNHLSDVLVSEHGATFAVEVLEAGGFANGTWAVTAE